MNFKKNDEKIRKSLIIIEQQSKMLLEDYTLLCECGDERLQDSLVESMISRMGHIEDALNGTKFFMRQSNESRILDKRHRDALEYAMQKISESPLAKYVRELYLYGSCSRGDYRWSSDVDLFLSLDRECSGMRREIRLLQSDVLSDDLSAAEVDLKIVFGDGWKDNNMTYYRNVKREGFRLWPLSKE